MGEALNYNRFHSWGYDSCNATERDLRKLLADRDIKVSDAVLAARGVVDRIDSEMPVDDPEALKDAILRGDSPEEIRAALLHELGMGQLQGAYRQARLDAVQAVRRAYNADIDALYDQLAERADVCIEHVHAVAELGTTDVATLVRNGDHVGARQLVELEGVVAELDVLRDLYRDLHPDPSPMRVNSIDGSEWVDLEPVRHAEIAPTRAGYLLNGIRLGGQLHYPTVKQAHEVAVAADATYQREQARQREQQRANAARTLGGSW